MRTEEIDYSPSAISMLDNVSQRLHAVLCDEAQRIAIEGHEQRVSSEHVLTALSIVAGRISRASSESKEADNRDAGMDPVYENQLPGDRPEAEPSSQTNKEVPTGV